MRSIYVDDNWAILQQEKEGGVAETYYYSEDGCEVKYVFVLRKAGIVDGVQYFDILTPRGMGGPRCINDRKVDLEKYDKSFVAYCKEKHIIAEYVRFDPWDCNHKVFGTLYDELEHHGDLFCNNLNIDFYKEEYDKNVKRNIKKSIDKIMIEVDFKGDKISEFLKIYKYTEEKYAVGDYYHLSEDFIRRYFDIMYGKVAVVNALYCSEVVSSLIVLFGEDIVHYHFACNNPLFREVNANTVLLYKIALLAKDMGKKLLDLGGGIIGGNTAGYKRRFVGEKGIYPYYVGKRVLNREIYQKLIINNGSNRKGFFPEYRRS